MSDHPDAGFSTLLADPSLEDRINAGLDGVERSLLSATTSEVDFVTEAARHLIVAGGKRFRPLVTLLAAEFGDRAADRDPVVDAAVVVELTHLATLYHDDVMDSADLRRGAESANERWGNSVAILTGDWVFARASEIVAGLGPECVRIQAQTFGRLVAGQMRETRGPADGADDQAVLDHYLSVVADKTASLISTSALLGSKVAGAPEDVQELLAEFGERLGTVFQLADDQLDVTSERSGKTPGTDLREGVRTLPTLYVRARARAGDDRLIELLDRPGDLSEPEVAEALTLLREHPGVADAEAEVRERAESARKLLVELPDIPARDALDKLCDLVVNRSV